MTISLCHVSTLPEEKRGPQKKDFPSAKEKAEQNRTTRINDLDRHIGDSFKEYTFFRTKVLYFIGKTGHRFTMRKIFRKIYIWLGAIFWSRRFKVSYIISSSFMLQAMACAYGTDEPYDRNCEDEFCYDQRSKDCQPTFDLQKKTDADYSECEQAIINTLSWAEDTKNKYGENSGKFESAWNLSLENARDIADTCNMDKLKENGIVSNYVCTDGSTVSVEEGEQIHAENKRSKN